MVVHHNILSSFSFARLYVMEAQSIASFSFSKSNFFFQPISLLAFIFVSPNLLIFHVLCLSGFFLCKLHLVQPCLRSTRESRLCPLNLCIILLERLLLMLFLFFPVANPMIFLVVKVIFPSYQSLILLPPYSFFISKFK